MNIQVMSARLLLTGTVIAGLLAGCRQPGPALPGVTPLDGLERIEGWVPYWTNEAVVVQEAVDAGFTDILLFHGTVELSGEVKLEDPGGLERGRQAATRGGARTWLTVTNHGKSLEGALGAGRLESHATSLLAAFARSSCEHLDLDYESMTTAQALQLPALARLLADQMGDDVWLSFTLQPVDPVYRPEQMDMVRELLAMPRVRTVRFMMYDYAWRGSLPGALCPLPAYQRLLDTWVGHGEKLTVCLPLYGYDWPRPEDVSLPRADTVLLRTVPELAAEIVWMREEAELAARYTKDGMPRMAALPSLRAVHVRVNAALDYGVPAVAFWHLGAAELAPVAEVCHRDGLVTEAVRYREIGGWSQWMDPFRRRVSRVITGDGRSLEEIAEQYGIVRATMLRFNYHVTDTTEGELIFLPGVSVAE